MDILIFGADNWDILNLKAPLTFLYAKLFCKSPSPLPTTQPLPQHHAITQHQAITQQHQKDCLINIDWSNTFATQNMPQSGVGSMQGSNKGSLPLKVVLHRRSSSIEGHLPNKGCLPMKVVFPQRASSTKGRLQPKVIFHQRLPCTKGRLPPKVFFHQRLSSTKGHLPP